MAEYEPRAQVKYQKEIIPYLMKKFGYKNVNQVPKLTKISLNMGIGDAKQDPKLLDNAISDLTIISGQKPAKTRAKKAISNFKLRIGMDIGCRITLRRKKMYEFSFDGRGNYSIGIKEQIIFPEINVDKIDRIRGLDVTVVTTASSDEEAYELLKSFGMPFTKQEIND